jgi:hypothetical protein
MDTKQKNKAPAKTQTKDGADIAFKPTPGKPYFIFKLRYYALRKAINHVS